MVVGMPGEAFHRMHDTPPPSKNPLESVVDEIIDSRPHRERHCHVQDKEHPSPDLADHVRREAIKADDDLKTCGVISRRENFDLEKRSFEQGGTRGGMGRTSKRSGVLFVPVQISILRYRQLVKAALEHDPVCIQKAEDPFRGH
jgi:hypothetical protein